MTPTYTAPTGICLQWIVERLAAALWEDWPMDLEIVIPEYQHGSPDFSLRGTCPHCGDKVSFSMPGRVGSFAVHSEAIPNEPEWRRWYPVMQCAACAKFILAVVRIKEVAIAGPVSHGETKKVYAKYEEHYPVGKPDDDVAEEVPVHIAIDFKEALRCRWVDGYNATVEMCRRAIEASCLELGAKPKLSITQKIDWVHKQGRINKTLKNVAHKIRLGGNRGSHPISNPDSEAPVSQEEADAVIVFTRHYLDHVYVVEKRMSKIDFPKSGRRVMKPKAEVSIPIALPPPEG